LRADANLSTGGTGPPEGTKEVTAVRVSLITALILSLGITAAAAVGLH